MKKDLSAKLIEILESDAWIIGTLKTVRSLNLNDAWIGAGFVRNKIWDHLHCIEHTIPNDIDVIYFDQTRSSKEDDLLIEQMLRLERPDLNWSVKNQARMHIRNAQKPYANCNNAISCWPETATSIAVRLNSLNRIEYIAPYGLDDLFNLLVIPTPGFDLKIYNERIEKKNWKERWTKLNIQTGNTHKI